MLIPVCESMLCQWARPVSYTPCGCNMQAVKHRKGAVTDKSQPRHKKYTQFYREEGVFFGIIYV